MLVFGAHVHHHSYRETLGLASELRKSLHKNVQTRFTKSALIRITGDGLVQGDAGKITIDAKRKLKQIQPLLTDQPGVKNKNRTATKKKLTAHRSIIRELLYIGRLVSPAISFHALTYGQEMQ